MDILLKQGAIEKNVIPDHIRTKSLKYYIHFAQAKILLLASTNLNSSTMKHKKADLVDFKYSANKETYEWLLM